MNNNPAIIVERQWFDAVEPLKQINESSFRDLIACALGKASGDPLFIGISSHSDLDCQHYWEMTEIVIRDISNGRPGIIRLTKEARNENEK